MIKTATQNQIHQMNQKNHSADKMKERRLKKNVGTVIYVI